jgi:hypothetical protein
VAREPEIREQLRRKDCQTHAGRTSEDCRETGHTEKWQALRRAPARDVRVPEGRAGGMALLNRQLVWDGAALVGSRLNPPARIGLVGSRDGVVGEALFNQQQSALSVPVEGIYGVEQALTLDQPRLVVLIDVEHEHEILCFEVAADR